MVNFTNNKYKKDRYHFLEEIYVQNVCSKPLLRVLPRTRKVFYQPPTQDNIDNEYGMDTLVSIVWCKIYKYGKYAYLYIKKYIQSINLMIILRLL